MKDHLTLWVGVSQDKSDAHRHYSSGSITLICHVISQYLVTQEPCYFAGRIPLKICHHPAKFDGHRTCGSGDIVVLVYHMISQDQVIKGSCDFMGGSRSWYVTILSRFVAVGFVVVEI